MADVDPWGYNLRQEIAAMMQSEMDMDLINVSKTLRDAFAAWLLDSRSR